MQEIGKRDRFLEGCLVAGLVLEFFLLLPVPWHLGTTYYDGYDYLENARFIAGVGAHYDPIRAPGLPLLLAPVYRWMAWTGISGDDLRPPHVVLFLLSWGFLLFLYRFFRRFHGGTLALVGVALMAGNRLFVHYVPFVMADLPVTAAFVLLLAYYDPWGPCSPLRQVGVGILLGVALLLKYPAGILIGLLALYEGFAHLTTAEHGKGGGAARLRRWGGVVLIGGATAFLVHAAIFQIRKGWGLPETIRALLWVFQEQISVNNLAKGSDTFYEYAYDLWKILTPGVALLFGVGVGVACRRRTRADLLGLLFGPGFILVMTLAVAFKEARYIFPAIPFCILLVLRGIEVCFPPLFERGVGRGIWRNPRRVFRGALLLLLLWPAGETIGEGFRLSDPFYRIPFARNVAYAVAQETPGRIYWFGGFYVRHPRSYIFSPLDEYFYLYHVGPKTIRFYLPERRIEAVGYRRGGRGEAEGPPFLPDLARLMGPEDTAILSLEETYRTSTLPERIPPLFALRLRFEEFQRISPVSGAWRFRSDRGRNLHLRRRDDGDWLVAGDALPRSELYLRLPGGGTRYLGPLPPLAPEEGVALPPQVPAALFHDEAEIGFRLVFHVYRPFLPSGTMRPLASKGEEEPEGRGDAPQSADRGAHDETTRRQEERRAQEEP